MNLLQILQPHIPALGDNFEKLGRTSGYYLCYRGGRFSLVHRSWIHRIIERLLTLLGCSSGTDLKTISHQIGKEAGAPVPLLIKIQSSWSRTFPGELCPFAIRIAAGQAQIEENQPLPQAEPRVLAEEPLAAPIPAVEIFAPAAVPIQVAPYRLRINGTILSLENEKQTSMPVDAIVNPTILPRDARNGSLNGGEDTISYEIFQAAGSARLNGECRQALIEREERRRQDISIVGRALPEMVTILKTSAGVMPPPILHIFHMAAPPFNPENDFMNRAHLKLSMINLLKFARLHKINKLSIPLMDRWGYPPLLVVETFWEVIQKWLREHKGVFAEVKLSAQGTAAFFQNAKEKAAARLQNFAEPF